MMPTFEPVVLVDDRCPERLNWYSKFEKVLPDGTKLFTESQLQQAYEPGKRDAVPEGFTLVPNEPTMPMLIELNEIAIIVAGLGHEDGPQRVLTDGYKAMLAAAPKGD